MDFLAAEGYGPFGVCGISFGAMLAYAAPQREPRLRSLAAILGDPSWCEPYEHLPAYEQVNVLAWNAGCDQHVDAAPARNFMRHLQHTRPEGSYEYHEYPESDHFMRPQDWAQGWSRTLDWFVQTLL